VTGRLNITNDGSAIVRYNTNGSIDTSFAQNGIFTPEADFNVGNSIGLQSNGKLVAFGYAYITGFAIARLNPNGTPDTSFGTNGRVITPINSSSGAAGGAVQSDGKILAFGSTYTPNGDSILQSSAISAIQPPRVPHSSILTATDVPTFPFSVPVTACVVSATIASGFYGCFVRFIN